MTRQTNPEHANVPPRTVGLFERSNAYRAEAHHFIPGGAHTYSKGDDQFPALSPAAIARGRNGHVWDVDGNEYVDCGLGLGAVSLGHAYEPVLQAVREQLEKGAAFQRPASIELEFAREFCAAIPGAERVKFAKNGSTVTTAALKLSRAFTGRSYVAFPGNHPFYSYDDWFVGRTFVNSGVPDSIQALSLHYDSTKPETLERLFRDYPGQIACVITEPEDVIPQPDAILHEVARITRKNGALLILDEMVTGYRAGFPGAGVLYGVDADLSTWGKAVGNGFSFCALTGRADIMDLGGIHQTKAPRVFLISTTHGGEAHTIAAARAVLREYQTQDVIGRQHRLTGAVADGLRRAAADYELEGLLEVHASPWRVICVCRDGQGQVSAPMRTLLIQEMIGRGVLFPALFLPCFTHTDDDVAQVINAFEASCAVYRAALEQGVDKFLVGEPTRPVFRKYNSCRQVCPSTPCPFEATCHPDS